MCGSLTRLVCTDVNLNAALSEPCFFCNGEMLAFHVIEKNIDAQ